MTGLTVSPSGELLLSGSPFRNIGVNYGGAIIRIFGQTDPNGCIFTPESEQDTAIAFFKSLGVKILRIKIFPYYPNQWKYGLNAGKAWNVATPADREAYYLKLDAFLNKCAAAGIGCICNFFFRIATVPDLVGDNNRQWLNASNTRTFATTITTEVVNRYINHPAVYGWELSNEVNHRNDTTDALKGSWPGIGVDYGTAASYPAATTCFNGVEWSTVCAWWYGVVKALDPNRIILTGNGPCSYTQPGGIQGVVSPVRGLFTEVDRDNPTNCGCTHFYGGINYTSTDYKGLGSLLTGNVHWMRNKKSAYILEEFGCQSRICTSISADANGVVTIVSNANLHTVVGDSIYIDYTGTGWDGVYVVDAVDAANTTITSHRAGRPSAPYSGSTGRINNLYGRFDRILDDIMTSGTQVALVWGYDLDPYFNKLESIGESGNSWMAKSITKANEKFI